MQATQSRWRPGVMAATVLLAASGPAAAHEGHLHWWELDTTWTWDPLVVVPLILMLWLWAIGRHRIAQRSSRGIHASHSSAVTFLAGWSALVIALVSPLHWLGERLFWSHMIEHQLLMSIAAPLLVLGRPMGPMLWGLPQRVRTGTGQLVHAISGSALWRWVTRPIPATALHALALWAWHVPTLYQAALVNSRVHWLQHLSFVVSALIFWWALLRWRDRGYGIAVLCLLATAIHSGMLGALLVGAQVMIFPLQTEAAAEWGLAPIEDQQLAGLIMWVPGGLVYAAAALAFAGVWISRSAGPAPDLPSMPRDP